MNGSPPLGAIAAGALALLALVYGVATFNGLVALRNLLKEAWADVDVQLKRRYDLIPSLVATVRGYAKHEREVFERIAELRGRAAANQGPVGSQGADEKPLVAALRQLLAVVERYPDLKADLSFLALQAELAGTEDRIAAARRFYNANARDLNIKVETFPSSLIASIFGFRRSDYWEVEEATQREAPAVAV
ncbi:MAG TPA: LemA family protein [Planctomycetota bacterium]|nr:LemA family protein [Planctomycetota bacterium]